MANPTYSTGTVSVTNGGTTVTGVGTLWTGVNAKAGDEISINGLEPVSIKDVTDATHLELWAPWAPTTQTTVAYKIIQDYPARVVGVSAAQDVGVMLSKLRTSGLPFLLDPGESPDVSLGANGQYTYQPDTGLLWLKTLGAWVLSAAPLLGSFLQAGTGAVARSILDKLTDAPKSIVDFGVKTTNTHAVNAPLIQAALDSGKSIYVPPGLWPWRQGTISNSNARIFGASKGQSVLTSDQTNTVMIQVAANLGNIEIENLGLTRSVTAVAGGVGINCAGYLDTSYFHDLEIQKQYVGGGLSSTGYSELSNCHFHDNIVDNVEMINTAGNGNLQWKLSFNLFEKAGNRGVLVLAVAGPAGVTMGDWINNDFFANSGPNLAVEGLPGTPINGLRIMGGVLGESGASNIRLNTYGGKHSIKDVYSELAGTRTTGPGFATAASHVGSGLEITANNLDVAVSGDFDGNSEYGIISSATVATNIGGPSRIVNNIGTGLALADGSKGQLSSTTFFNNTAGDLTVTTNASSLVSEGNRPTSLNTVGKYVQSSIAAGSQVALTNNTPALLTSISLTAGDWDVTLQPIFIGGATTLTNYIFASVSSSGALDTSTPGAFASIGFPTGGTAIYASATGISMTISPFRFNLSGTTTISAFALSGFNTSTAGVYGLLRARRAHD